jgi:hypothetical protein
MGGFLPVPHILYLHLPNFPLWGLGAVSQPALRKEGCPPSLPPPLAIGAPTFPWKWPLPSI